MNRQQFFLKMIVGSLVRRRSRMLVALLAVAIGATILSGLITVYYDIPRQMGQEFRSYGANLLLVPAGDEVSFGVDTVRRAADMLPSDGAVGVAPYCYQMVKINEQPFMAAGTALDEARKASPYWFVSGRWPERGGEVLIGQEVSDVVRLLPGQSFTMVGPGADGGTFSQTFAVSGVVQTGGAEEAFVFMALDDFVAMTGRDRIDVVECSVSASGSALADIAARIESGVPGVSARLVRRVTQSEGAVLTKLQSLVYLVTVVVLLLTMICVATTMMAVVAERRREIGLKKALGAANRSIVSGFLGEGIFLGGIGGLLGDVLGFLFAQVVGQNVFSRSIAFQPLLIPITLAASIAVTALACLLPVRSATDVDPAIVLRGE
ncbi:MAG: ABC transporter permease [Oscillospiraceae bacterium]|jgi:putative ABC transport system permease protein|nr:ABC transporter permease [Oscillospiraceae bacterium]